jgi:4-amino-4-deoxy-L-arabinose transferase-like glycosyltransferase
MNKLNKCFDKLKIELAAHKLHYFLLFVVLMVGFALRVYRTGDLLGFYYDQGRDAMVIWDLWHEGKLFLIGPVTGLAGIFLGPFYYYLIAPFYLIGNGNPVYPAVFLAFLATASAGVVYYLGRIIQNKETGLLAAFIASLSYVLVLSGRWLSNPTPILLTSVLLFLSLYKILNNGGKIWWILAFLFAGISLHFEAASAFFYLVILFVFTVYIFFKQKNLFPGIKVLIVSAAVLFATILPQLLFDLRHDFLLTSNFLRTFAGGEGFKLSFWEVLGVRAHYFWSVFHTKIFPEREGLAGIFAALSVLGIILGRKKLKANTLKIFTLFLTVPVVGYILFQGNYGNIYDYYMTGFYLPIMLLFSLGLGYFWRNAFGKATVILFLFIFAFVNFRLLNIKLSAGVDVPTRITLGNQMQALDWIYNDTDEVFNIDVYVPPVIPHAYDYLFLWQGTRRCGSDLCGLVGHTRYGQIETHVPLLYTLYEVDPPHPNRLETWLTRQEGIGEVVYEERFGGIVVQRRTRI